MLVQLKSLTNYKNVHMYKQISETNSHKIIVIIILFHFLQKKNFSNYIIVKYFLNLETNKEKVAFSKEFKE